jgi:hypothetical protein
MLLLWYSNYTRFREIATFGRGTIRRFGNNVSGMKKLAARDFEDILQVCLFWCIVFIYLTLILHKVHNSSL